VHCTSPELLETVPTFARVCVWICFTNVVTTFNICRLRDGCPRESIIRSCVAGFRDVVVKDYVSTDQSGVVGRRLGMINKIIEPGGED